MPASCGNVGTTWGTSPGRRAGGQAGWEPGEAASAPDLCPCLRSARGELCQRCLLPLKSAWGSRPTGMFSGTREGLTLWVASRDLFGQPKGDPRLVQDRAGVGLTGLCALLPPKRNLFPFGFFPAKKAYHSLGICPSRRLSTLGPPSFEPSRGPNKRIKGQHLRI